ncbi:MAG: hypothetical protein CML13_01690 [Puniceicoccaceae bacterium]|nr:hypothetical protein [Puniceicoccaceae bacterium]
MFLRFASYLFAATCDFCWVLFYCFRSKFELLNLEFSGKNQSIYFDIQGFRGYFACESQSV